MPSWKNEKFKSSIYYPKDLYKALKRMYGENAEVKKINDMVIDIILDHPDVKKMINKIQKEKESDKT